MSPYSRYTSQSNSSCSEMALRCNSRDLDLATARTDGSSELDSEKIDEITAARSCMTSWILAPLIGSDGRSGNLSIRDPLNSLKDSQFSAFTPSEIPPAPLS